MTVNPITPTTTNIFLGSKKRPPDLENKIDTVFKKVQNRNGGWKFIGASQYYLCGIEDAQLIKTIVNHAPKEQKEMYFLDIGAGRFDWASSTALTIQENTERPDMTVHIVSVSGETSDIEKTDFDNCILHNFGPFKIENLASELDNRGLPFENSYDLIVSKWCLRHLVSPLETWAQAVHALRPETGLFLGDGFFFLLNDQEKSTSLAEGNQNMVQLLQDSKTSFLMHGYSQSGSLNQYIVRKPAQHSSALPMKYHGFETLTKQPGLQIASYCMTRFSRELPLIDPETINWPLPESNHYSGDRTLYDWLDQNKLLPSDETDCPRTYKPIFKES